MQNKISTINSRERGAAMIISLIFFIVASVLVVLGLTGPTAREFRTANDAVLSRQSYFLAESGVEDAFYRLKNSLSLPSSVTLLLGSSSTVTAITDLGGGQKEIASTGNVYSNDRAVDVKVSTGIGASFNYGVQVGEGGLNMTGSGRVNGNVYANGPVTGDSSAIITGTATSAGSTSSTADQTNGTGTPAYNVSFGNATTTQDIAQSFELATLAPINKIQLYVKKLGSPANGTIKIMNDSGGVPGTTQYATGTLLASSVTTSYGWIDVSMTTNPVLTTGITYWLVVDASVSSTNYYVVGANSAGYANGIGMIGQTPSTWNSTTPAGLDYYFNIFLGGISGLIQGNSLSIWNPLHVGTVSGNALAHTVNYSNVTGTIYCTAGTGNNHTCTSAADPVFQAFPISDANIDSWKSDAVAGGTLSGDYSVGWAGATLGPKKIVGNLTVSGGGTLTITGTLWVTGKITLNGGGLIKLDSSFGANDGMMIGDGDIEVNGGGHAAGSGTTGSYIMFISTKNGGTASVDGGAGAVIMYVPYGTLAIDGGASLKEATAYRVTIAGGSTLTYESGLASLSFSSGPSGSYSVNSWKETQ